MAANAFDSSLFQYGLQQPPTMNSNAFMGGLTQLQNTNAASAAPPAGGDLQSVLNQIYVQQFNDQVNQRVNQYLRSRGAFNDNASAAANWLSNPTSANDAALMNYKQSLDPNVQAEMAQRYPQYGAAPGQQAQGTDIRESGDMSSVLTAMQEYMNSMRGLRYEGWGGQNGVGPGVSGPAGPGDEGYGGSGTADGGTGGMW